MSAMLNPHNYSPIETAVALSLYLFNVPPFQIAKKLHDHFNGDCAELEDLFNYFADRTSRKAYLATELAMPTALVLVHHALEKYGEEARGRVRINLDTLSGSMAESIAGIYSPEPL